MQNGMGSRCLRCRAASFRPIQRARTGCCNPDGPRRYAPPQILLAALGLLQGDPPPQAPAAPEPMGETERRVLSCIGPEPRGVEELAVRSGLPTAVLLGSLMRLELSGRVLCQPGKRYVLR